MVEHRFTRCPGCATVFRITAAQLALREGQVRCGHCRAVFDANDHFVSLDAPRRDDFDAPDELAMGRPTVTLRSADALRPVADDASTKEVHPPARAAREAGSDTTSELSGTAASPASIETASEAAGAEAASAAGAEAASAAGAEARSEAGAEATSEAGAKAASEAGADAVSEGAIAGVSEAAIAGASDAVSRPAAASTPSGVATAAPAPIDIAALDRGGRFEWQPRKPLRERPKALYAAAFVLLLVALALQAVLEYRDALAAHAPFTRPILERACGLFGCVIGPLRDTAALSIDASDLQADPAHRGLLLLTATIRNRATYAIAYPHLELTLTDASDQTVVRRAFAPAEYLGGTMNPAAGIPGNGERLVRLFIDASATTQAGYRLYLFYP